MTAWLTHTDWVSVLNNSVACYPAHTDRYICACSFHVAGAATSKFPISIYRMNEWMSSWAKERTDEWRNKWEVGGKQPFNSIGQINSREWEYKLQQQWSLLNCLNFIDCVLRKRSVIRHNLLIALEQLVMSFLWIVKEHPNFRFRSPDCFRKPNHPLIHFRKLHSNWLSYLLARLIFLLPSTTDVKCHLGAQTIIWTLWDSLVYLYRI